MPDLDRSPRRGYTFNVLGLITLFGIALFIVFLTVPAGIERSAMASLEEGTPEPTPAEPTPIPTASPIPTATPPPTPVPTASPVPTATAVPTPVCPDEERRTAISLGTSDEIGLFGLDFRVRCNIEKISRQKWCDPDCIWLSEAYGGLETSLGGRVYVLGWDVKVASFGVFIEGDVSGSLDVGVRQDCDLSWGGTIESTIAGTICAGIGLESQARDVFSIEFSARGCTSAWLNGVLVSNVIEYEIGAGNFEAIGVATIKIFGRPVLDFSHSWQISGGGSIPGQIDL